MRKTLLITGLLLSLAGGISAATPEEDAAANARARMEAAQKVYKGMLARAGLDPNIIGPGYFEQLHRWSRRWMESQAESGTKKDQIAAAEAHLVRMRELEKTARKLDRFLAAYEISAIEFYRLDAEKHLRAVRKK